MRNLEARPGEEEEASCKYYGRILDDPAGGLRHNYRWVLVPCPPGGLVPIRCMLKRADHIVRAHVDPRFSVAYRSEWARGGRTPYPEALVRGCE